MIKFVKKYFFRSFMFCLGLFASCYLHTNSLLAKDYTLTNKIDVSRGTTLNISSIFDF